MLFTSLRNYRCKILVCTGIHSGLGCGWAVRMPDSILKNASGQPISRNFKNWFVEIFSKFKKFAGPWSLLQLNLTTLFFFFYTGTVPLPQKFQFF